MFDFGHLKFLKIHLLVSCNQLIMNMLFNFINIDLIFYKKSSFHLIN